MTDVLSADHLARLGTHRERLRRLVRAAVDPTGGFGWLDDSGRRTPGRPVELWVTTRMTHVAALGLLEGDATMQAPIDHGVQALRTLMRDSQFGGWYAAVQDGEPTNSDKRAYEHAFVVLAAASAVVAGHPDAPPLLDEALGVWERRFWVPEDRLALDVWNRDWSVGEDYRGANANMHTVEALLAAADVTGERRWADDAAAICERMIREFAGPAGFRLPEHYTTDWVPVPDYNRDQPADPFRPYGVTIGHLLEWARLLLHLRTGLGDDAPDWLLDHARGLFEVAVRDGWSVDDRPGFVYTTDFDGTPVVSDRLHWVVTEGVGAAWALHLATGETHYLERYHAWWQHGLDLFVDTDGSWRPELDSDNQPASQVWQGRPDIYHAYQAALLPALPFGRSFVGAMLAARSTA